jgi:hypothetical protein
MCRRSAATGWFYGIAAIPEPGTLSLLGLGVLSVLGLRRRRR